jgi:hypothetical protein
MPTSSGPPISMATTIPNSAPLPDSEFLSNEMAWMTFNNQQNYMRQSWKNQAMAVGSVI